MNRNGKKYTQYKAFNAYLEKVKNNEDLSLIVDSLVSSNNFKNEITYSKNNIEINEDWIEKIEFYLPFLVTAVSQGRRFILNEGEVQEIEKVRKVSKDSIYDLSKHSDKIRKVTALEEVEPKKLLIIEKTDDYNLYENRFLVFLLNYLRSFIAVRFDKIKNAQAQRQTFINAKNTTENIRDGLSFEFILNDVSYKDYKVEENDVNKDKLQRINKINAQISRLYETELIKIVSKSAPISEPILKNNTLKNEPNFVKCYEFYEFLKGYKEDGFKISLENNKTSLNEEALSYFKYLPALLSFITSSSLNNLYPSFKEEFGKETIEDKERYLKDIKQMVDEFLASKKKDSSDLEKIIYDLITLNSETEKNKNELANKMNSEIETLNSNLLLVKKDKENEINSLNKEHEKEKNDLNSEIEKLKIEFKEKEDKYLEEISSLKSQNKALNITLNKNYNEEILRDEDFDNLENEFNAFYKFILNTWKKYKAEMKKESKKKAIEMAKKKEKFNGK